MKTNPLLKRSHVSSGARRVRSGVRVFACLMFGIAIGFSPLLMANSLDDVRFTSLPGDRVQVRLDFANAPSTEPLSFTIDNPARIALDFPGTELHVKEKSKEIGVGMAHSVSAVEAGGRTRVVLNLVRMVPYDVSLQGNSVLVTLGNADAGIEAEQALPLPAGRQAAVGASIQDIDFRRGDKGQGRVLVQLSDPNIGINIKEEGGQILVDFASTDLPDRLDRKLDVIDFATPVQEVDTFRHANGTRMVIKPTGYYDHLVYQAGNLLTVEVRPMTKAEEEQAKKEKFGYTGERLSLNFQNIEVRAVLQLIADFTGLNMVASDTVSGTVTLRLKNVPWDQALDIILKSKGLGMRQVGNVIMVAPQEEIAAREKLELEAQQQLAELAPLRTEFVQVNYAKAGDLAKLLKAEANNLLSERGNIAVDERTNTLLIQDTAEKLEEMRKVVTRLDIPVRQVMIESRIVVADTSFMEDIGVQFGYSKNTIEGPGEFGAVVGGKRPGEVNFFDTGTAYTDPGTGNENFIVDLPVVGVDPAADIALAVGKIGSWLLQLELSALQAEGRGEVISNPKVITANQKEAVIEDGTEIPYQEATSSGATNVQFKKAVLSLTVTPQITPDDRIILDLRVNNDTVGEVFAGVPSIDTRSVETQVLVENGETVVLGGIFKETKRNDVDRVPFFGELPYVGHLFRRTHKENSKDELLIFVTPKILKETLTLN